MFRHFLLSAVMICVGVLAVAEVAHSAPVSADLSWTIPTERTDGTPIEPEEIASYRIFYGVDAAPGAEPVAIVEDGQTKTLTIELAPRAERYTVQFAVAAVDTSGIVSEWSNIAVQSFMVRSTARPMPPTELRVNVTCAGGACQIIPVQ